MATVKVTVIEDSWPTYLKNTVRILFKDLGVIMAETIEPTRFGVDDKDKKTPFVQDKLGPLLRYYYSYQDSVQNNAAVGYAEMVRLRIGNNGGFKDGLDVNELRIEIINSEYKINERLRAHADVAVKLFKDLKKIKLLTEDGLVYENNESARVCDWSVKEGKFVLMPAWYFDQVATNLTLDWASGYVDSSTKATIRNNVEGRMNGGLRSFRESQLANTLGVATYFHTSDKKILVVIRGLDLAIMSGVGKFHCSASGVFKWHNLPGGAKEARFSSIMNGMREEIWEELALKEYEYELIPLAFGRELARGGKPQFFFYAYCPNLTADEVIARANNAIERKERIDKSEIEPDSPLFRWLDDPASVPPLIEYIESCFTYEGWAGLKLLQTYLAEKGIAVLK